MTRRSVIIGLLLIPLSSFWISNSEMVTIVTEITSTSLLIGAVFILFVLVLLNVLLERFAPRHALTGAEMLTIYVMLTIGMSINGIGMFGFLTTALCNPFWFATPENGWSDFFPYIPSWFAPQSKTAIKYFYPGESSFHQLENLRAWITPILTWSLFTFAQCHALFHWITTWRLCERVYFQPDWRDLRYPDVQGVSKLTAALISIEHSRDNPLWLPTL